MNTPNTKPTTYAISYNQPTRGGCFRWHVYATLTAETVHAATSATKKEAIEAAHGIARNLGGRLEATGFQAL